MQPSQKLFFIILCTTLLGGCGKSSIDKFIDDLRGRKPYDYIGPDPVKICESTISYEGTTVTIRGLAKYEAWSVTDQGLTEPIIAKPIRYMEVAVFKGESEIKPVQCATTESDGSFSFKLPKGSEPYKIVVRSRSFKDKLKASVFNRPEKNQLYGLEAVVNPTEDKDVGTLVASAKKDVLGGAFNILDQFLNANEYLRTQLSKCSTKIKGCTDFIVAEKVNVYWEKGFNPGNITSDVNGISTNSYSFYSGGSQRRLFILGGSSGDVLMSDTDHFDNSIILHEYGHFLEDVYSTSNSPGGTHSGNKTIDPRLALSEGWGNFFQAAVLNESEPAYKDTFGNAEGKTHLSLSIPIESVDRQCIINLNAPGCDLPIEDGEGNYREFAITRFFWDIVDSNVDVFDGGRVADDISNRFVEIWKSFTRGQSSADEKSKNIFRAVGSVHIFQESLVALDGQHSNWELLQNVPPHKQEAARFIIALQEATTCKLFSIPAPVNPNLSSVFFNNNRFFQYSHSGGILDLSIESIDADEAQLSASIIDAYRMGSSKLIEVRNSIDSKNYLKTTLETAEKGEYLIQVTSKWSSELDKRSAINYSIKKGDQELCP